MYAGKKAEAPSRRPAQGRATSTTRPPAREPELASRRLSRATRGQSRRRRRRRLGRLAGPMAEITITLPDGSRALATRGRHWRRPRRVDRLAAWPRPRSRPWSTATSGTSAGRCPTARTVAIVTADTDEGRHVLRHSTAHVLAQAVTQLFPGAKFSIGPAIEDGFYYDFDLPGGQTFTDDDLGRHRGPDARDRRRPTSRSCAPSCRRRGAGALRRPAVQVRDHRAGPGSAEADDADAGEVGAGEHDQRLPQHRPSSSTCAAARTCRRTGRSATSS